MAACIALTALGARPYAGSWNDGSRLAAVEAIADHGTFAIDESVFCRPPANKAPYGPGHADYQVLGTYDKLRIDGHFYSDKPAVVSLLLAGVYRVFQVFGFPTAAARPDLFCWMLTVISSGLALAVAAGSLFRLGALVRLSDGVRFLWVGSFVFATVAMAYTRHVNNHIMLLGVTAAICLGLVRLADDSSAGIRNWTRLAWLGTLAGLAFNLDFGAGPLLVITVVGCVALRCRSFLPTAAVCCAALPWIAAGIGINYAIGGVWKPINMVPQYLDWPKSPFTAANLTGFSRHGPARLAFYAFSLLFGRQGFHLHNLALVLTVPAAFVAFWRLRDTRLDRYRLELGVLLGWCVATWLLYSLLSNNSSGICCSVRWFVPFLAPAYFLLAIGIRDSVAIRRHFCILSAWGAINGIFMWTAGPWIIRATPLFWMVVLLAAVSSLWMLANSTQPAETVGDVECSPLRSAA